MQLMRLADVPLDRHEQVFRYSRSRAVIGAMILIALALTAFVFGWRQGAWLAYYVAAVGVIFLLIFQKLITARFRASNWLLRMTDQGLLIKFRSYLNSHFSDQDLTVVFIPYSEIRSARLVKERQELPDREEPNRPEITTRTRLIVELELAGTSTQIAKALATERDRLFSKSVIGAGRISTRYQHLPVHLASSTILRIEWGVVPSPQILLDALTRHTLAKRPQLFPKTSSTSTRSAERSRKLASSNW